MNIAINGFGRIGRSAFKVLFSKQASAKIKIVAINDLSEGESLANLLKYDSVYGIYDKKVEVKKDSLIIDGQVVKLLSEKDPANLPWKEMKVDVVLECTGIFRTKDSAGLHLKAGAKKVIISAPAKDESVKTIVLGVNQEKLKASDNIISMASCTTNCLAPITKIIKDNFGLKKAIMTTIHSYTAGQNLVDGPNKDPRRARAAALNMVPTTTGAAKATTLTIPSLKNKFDGLAVRVPTPVGSIADAVYVINKKTDLKTINQVFKKAANSTALKGLLKVSEEPIVLSDIVGDSASAIVDLPLTMLVDGDLLKVIAWYDNEWGYSSRLVDLAIYLKQKRLV